MVSQRRRERAEHVLRHRLKGLAVVCENFANPHNVAAVLRTCEAMGLLDVYIVEEKQPSKLCKKATAGADQWLSIHRYRRVRRALEDLRETGYRIFASTPKPGAAELEALPCHRPLALVFGNEQDGVTAEAMAGADGTFTIPMYGFVGSLNVSAAAAISIYHCARQLRRHVGDGDLPAQEVCLLREHYVGDGEERRR